MIGIFDSGSGGLTLLAEMQKILPEYDYIYFGDYKNCPYGNKDKSEILHLTRNGVIKLRDAGAKIVILACNTATWASIRELQSEENILGVKVLGVTIPGAERVVEERYKTIAVFATQASAQNNLYKERVHILDVSVDVTEIWMQNFASDIESYLLKQKSEQEIYSIIQEQKKYISPETEAIVLGCTHYSYMKDAFSEIFPTQHIICPSEESAKKFKTYLERHPEIEKELWKNGRTKNIS